MSKVSKQIVISDTVVHAESENGYNAALEDALGGASASSGPDCIVNIVIFGMGFRNGKFQVSVQIIVTGPDPGAEDGDGEDDGGKKLDLILDDNEQSHEQDDMSIDYDQDVSDFYKPESQLATPKSLSISEPDPVTDYNFDMSIANEEVLMQFNNEAIYDRLEAKLEDTWEVNPESRLWQDIKSIVESNLDKSVQIPDQTVETPASQKKVTYLFHNAELNVPPEEQHLTADMNANEVREAVYNVFEEKCRILGIEPDQQKVPEILSFEDVRGTILELAGKKSDSGFHPIGMSPVVAPNSELDSENKFRLKPFEYNTLRVYTEEIDDLSQLAPPDVQFGLELFKHLHEKQIEEDVQQRVEQQLKNVLQQIPGVHINFALTQE